MGSALPVLQLHSSVQYSLNALRLSNSSMNLTIGVDGPAFAHGNRRVEFLAVKRLPVVAACKLSQWRYAESLTPGGRFNLVLNFLIA
jgi:hypothetical protein